MIDVIEALRKLPDVVKIANEILEYVVTKVRTFEGLSILKFGDFEVKIEVDEIYKRFDIKKEIVRKTWKCIEGKCIQVEEKETIDALEVIIYPHVKYPKIKIYAVNEKERTLFLVLEIRETLVEVSTIEFAQLLDEIMDILLKTKELIQK